MKTVLPEDNLPKQKKTVEQSLYEPGEYEITSDHTFTIEIPLSKTDNRWRIDPDQPTVRHWAKFRMWTYLEEQDMRKKSTKYDELKRMHFIDSDMLDRFKLQKLLQEWSFGEDNENLKLHHVNGVMTDKCFENVMKLHPNILRFLLNSMNGVLERNG